MIRQTGAIPWLAGALLTTTVLALTSCSGESGSFGTSPTEPRVLSIISVLGRVQAEEGVGIRRVTMLLDGEEIGEYVAPAPDGFTSVIVAGSKIGVDHGAYTLEFRFDSLSRSPADVIVEAEVSYEIDPDPLQELDLGPREATVDTGGSVRFGIEI